MDTSIIAGMKLRQQQDKEDGLATILNQCTVAQIIKCFDQLQAENKRLREALEKIEQTSTSPILNRTEMIITAKQALQEEQA